VLGLEACRAVRVYLMTDLEGAAGVATHVHHSFPNGKYHDASKKLLTGEVNAAVEGLLEAGVEDVLVVDGHGPGGIDFELLHPEARLLHGRPLTRQQMLEPIWDHDAMVMIGQHAKSGRRHGNQNHTLSSSEIDWIQINGHAIGEIGIMALWAGIKSVPLIFLSGDEEACAEAKREIPGIATAAVKKGLSSNAEITLSAPAACNLIRRAITAAVGAHRAKPVPPLILDPPFQLDIRWKTTALADTVEHQTGCERIDDQTVAFTSPRLLDVLLHRHAGLESTSR